MHTYIRTYTYAYSWRCPVLTLIVRVPICREKRIPFNSFGSVPEAELKDQRARWFSSCFAGWRALKVEKVLLFRTSWLPSNDVNIAALRGGEVALWMLAFEFFRAPREVWRLTRSGWYSMGNGWLVAFLRSLFADIFLHPTSDGSWFLVRVCVCSEIKNFYLYSVRYPLEVCASELII